MDINKLIQESIMVYNEKMPIPDVTKDLENALEGLADTMSELGQKFAGKAGAVGQKFAGKAGGIGQKFAGKAGGIGQKLAGATKEGLADTMSELGQKFAGKAGAVGQKFAGKAGGIGQKFAGKAGGIGQKLAGATKINLKTPKTGILNKAYSATKGFIKEHPKLAAGAALGVGALGAGLAAKKYLAKRKAAKATV